MDENNIMLFGKHKGKHIEDVPDEWLLWFAEEGYPRGRLKDYLIENIESIRQNVKNAQNGKKV